jgi:prepilin-type N-terminal cleavage/methylation domain-containing protein
MKRSGFTMIELIFVIVILGILAAVAIPKLAATRDDAKISKINSDAATFVSDLGSFYTSKGTYGTSTLADVTNVAFGTTASPTATSTTLAGATLNLTDGTNICLVFTPAAVATADGNLSIAAGAGTGTICTAVKAAAVKANLLAGTAASPTTKLMSFGGTSIVQ